MEETLRNATAEVFNIDIGNKEEVIILKINSSGWNRLYAQKENKFIAYNFLENQEDIEPDVFNDYDSLINDLLDYTNSEIDSPD